MRLIALYKTFDGGEWIGASLDSIYDHVDNIVIVHSETSWLGSSGNTARAPAIKWAKENDHFKKIHHVNVETTSQEQQYAAGIAYIRRHDLPFDAVLAVDSDEIWEADDLARAKQQASGVKFAAYRCNMHTYIKTPFYRVAPPYGSPAVLFRDPELLTQSPRGCRAPAMQLNNVWMHHYSYVRKTRMDVWRKIHQSCYADGDELVVPRYMDKVYDRLPEGRHIHAFIRWREVWDHVVSVWWSDLPRAVRESDIIKLWWPNGLMMDGELNALFDLALGRRQAVDLGTYCGLSAVALSLAAERVHTVDAYQDVRHMATSGGGRGGNTHYSALALQTGHTLQSVRETLNRFGNITSEQSATEYAASQWRGGAVDFLFVDADHSCEATLANVHAWWPHLSDGARIVFHDYNDIHPGVMEAVDSLRRSSAVRDVPLPQYSGSLFAVEKTQ